MNNEREITCCFTGHRPDKLPWGSCENDARCAELNSRIYSEALALYNEGYRRFICGMALGCDMYFATQIAKLKKEHPEVILQAAVPCPEQSSLWSEKQKEQYDLLLSQCDEQKLIQSQYTPDCMMRRNRYMVDSSSAIIACFDGSSGGTMQTLLLAMRSGLRIIKINI